MGSVWSCAPKSPRTVLQANNWFLLYYATDAPSEPLLAVVDLASAEDVRLSLSDSRVFTVAFADGSRYELRAPTLDIAAVWVRGLLGRANWALDNPEVVQASRAAHAAARTGMGATDALGIATAPPRPSASPPATFADIEQAARARRAEAERHTTTMAAQASLSAADAVRRSSMFRRDSTPAKPTGTGTGTSALAIPEGDDDEEEEEVDADSGDDEDSETEDGPAGTRHALTIAEAMASVTAELGAQPMMEGKCEKRKSETKWQHRYLRVMAGVVAYCVNKDKAAITTASPLGQPRGVIPLEIVAAVRRVPAGTAGADCIFVIECIAAPDDDAARARIEETCAAEAKDQPEGRHAKPPWGRAFYFRTKRAERAAEWADVIASASKWWTRCRELLADVPMAAVDGHHAAHARASRRGDGVATASATAATSTAAAAAAAGKRGGGSDSRRSSDSAGAAAAVPDLPEWLEGIEGVLHEMASLRASAPEGTFREDAEDGDDDEDDEGDDADDSRGGDAGSAVRRAFATLESAALDKAHILASAAATKAKDLIAEEDAKRTDGAVGELLALRQLGPAIEAVTAAFRQAMETCKTHGAAEAAKVVVRGFDMTLAVELRPFQTGVGAMRHGSMSFDAMLDRVAALERYLELRTFATSSMHLEFRNNELTMASRLQEQRLSFVEGVVALAKTSYSDAIARLVKLISRWDDSVAQPQPSSGRTIPERTIAPRNLATLFNLHLRQASRCRCALLQQLLLSATWEALSSFSSKVMTALDEQYRLDPSALLAGDGIVICRVINDCMALAKFVEDKGTEVTKALEDEGALLDRRELEAGTGDGITEQLEEERQELEGLLTDRPRIVHSLLKIGYSTLSVLKDLIMSELAAKHDHGPGLVGKDKDAGGTGADGEEDEDARPPLPLLFGPDWESPAKPEARPISCTISLLLEWFTDLDSWLARLWMRRLTGLMLESVVEVYCTALVNKLQRGGLRIIGIGGWPLTSTRRQLILEDFAGLDKFFEKMERRFAVTDAEKAAVMALKAADGSTVTDSASLEIRKAVMETDTELRRLRGILRNMAQIAGASTSSLLAIGTRAICNYSSHGVELFRFAERVIQVRDDITRAKRTELIRQLEDICTSYGRHDAERLPVPDTTLQFNADNAVLRVLNRIFPDGVKQQQQYWARHTAPPPRTRAPQRAPVAHVVSAADALEARVEMDGEVAMTDFMGTPSTGGAAAASATGNAAGMLPTMAGEDTPKSPGSVASRRRRSKRPSGALFNALRRMPRASAATRGGIGVTKHTEAAKEDEEQEEDDDEAGGGYAGGRAAASGRPSGVPGRAEPSPDTAGKGGFGTAAPPLAAAAAPPVAVAAGVDRRPTVPTALNGRSGAKEPGNPFAAPEPVPAPRAAPAPAVAASGAGGGAGEGEDQECNAQ